jgi:hypothetical protein
MAKFVPEKQNPEEVIRVTTTHEWVIMKVEEYLSEMKRITGELHDLFVYPDIGTYTWHEAVNRKMKELDILYYGTEKS